MRRPVSVKSVFLFPPCGFLAFEPSRLCRHLSIRTLLLSDSRSVQVGFPFQQVLLPDNRRRLPSLGTEVAPGVSRSRLNSAVELGSPDARLSAHPQDREWRTSSLGRTGWP